MLEVSNSRLLTDPVGDLASEVLADLYRAVCGHQPKAVRAYHEDDALLLLLRFEPEAIGDGDPAEVASRRLLDDGLPRDARHDRLGDRGAQRPRLLPGNLSVCAERGLAVFAFSAMDEDPTSARATISSASTPPRRPSAARPALRLAS